MKIRVHKRHPDSLGSILLGALVIGGLLGVSLAGYLKLVSFENRLSSRSQLWNMAMPVAESGIDEALAHLNSTNNLYSNNWSIDDSTGCYVKTNWLTTNSFYFVTISNALNLPVIRSEGYVRDSISSNWIVRRVMVIVRRGSPFFRAMLSVNDIRANGNRLTVDSFDSTDPMYSLNGAYTSARRKDNGDIGSIFGNIDIGNADIYGRAGVGPNGKIYVGAQGSIGSNAWHAAGYKGIQPGMASYDLTAVIQDTYPPYSTGLAPTSGQVNGVNYEYLLGSGNYYLSSLQLSGQQKVLVTGQATLFVNGPIKFSGQSTLIIATNASLKLYVNGTADLTGQGVLNANNSSTNFFLIGLPGCTSIDLRGNSTMRGIVYAPYANFSLRGGGNNDEDFVGAVVCKSVNMRGHFNFHYDEAIRNLQWNSTCQVVSWTEY